ncbi:DNA mismatch endonuclease Vsr [Candidatus Woesearchaeota archaeon]|nr:DNA mismatch endonuclease Vsr [Candidatus Woesearchaeota archaeon]
MADTFTKEQRSSIMAKVKGKNTCPELNLKKLLSMAGIKYTTNRKLEGKPDIILKPQKVTIFIDGCFWHKCPICFRAPKSNTSYWKQKIKKNVNRDRKLNKTLKKEGWKVIRIWEHDVFKNPDKVLFKIIKNII